MPHVFCFDPSVNWEIGRELFQKVEEFKKSLTVENLDFVQIQNQLLRISIVLRVSLGNSAFKDGNFEHSIDECRESLKEFQYSPFDTYDKLLSEFEDLVSHLKEQHTTFKYVQGWFVKSYIQSQTRDKMIPVGSSEYFALEQTTKQGYFESFNKACDLLYSILKQIYVLSVYEYNAPYWEPYILDEEIEFNIGDEPTIGQTFLVGNNFAESYEVAHELLKKLIDYYENERDAPMPESLVSIAQSIEKKEFSELCEMLDFCFLDHWNLER